MDGEEDDERFKLGAATIMWEVARNEEEEEENHIDDGAGQSVEEVIEILPEEDMGLVLQNEEGDCKTSEEERDPTLALREEEEPEMRRINCGEETHGKEVLGFSLELDSEDEGVLGTTEMDEEKSTAMRREVGAGEEEESSQIQRFSFPDAKVEEHMASLRRELEKGNTDICDHASLKLLLHHPQVRALVCQGCYACYGCLPLEMSTARERVSACRDLRAL